MVIRVEGGNNHSDPRTEAIIAYNKEFGEYQRIYGFELNSLGIKPTSFKQIKDGIIFRGIRHRDNKIQSVTVIVFDRFVKPKRPIDSFRKGTKANTQSEGYDCPEFEAIMLASDKLMQDAILTEDQKRVITALALVQEPAIVSKEVADITGLPKAVVEDILKQTYPGGFCFPIALSRAWEKGWYDQEALGLIYCQRLQQYDRLSGFEQEVMYLRALGLDRYDIAGHYQNWGIIEFSHEEIIEAVIERVRSTLCLSPAEAILFYLMEHGDIRDSVAAVKE
jgi:hypothetical protein